MSKQQQSDVLIVGGGPAGASAALAAAQAGVSVTLIERQGKPPSGVWPEWLGPAGVALCAESGLSAKDVDAVEFRGLRLHAWDLKSSTEVEDDGLHGWIVNRHRFDSAMLNAAKEAGATIQRGSAVTGLDLAEDHAELTLENGRGLRGRVVLIADGTDSTTARRANLVPAAAMHDVARNLTILVNTKKPRDSLDVIIGGSRNGQLATIVQLGKTVRATFATRDQSAQAMTAFRELCARATEADLLPACERHEVSERPCPAGVALGIDAHFGKGCLLIGDAGGFAADFSNEGIYPAMRSGQIAVETLRTALEAPVLQDELARFGAAWRGELADYLRMPHTDLSLLMPLVFSNPQMSKRVAQAFLLGQTF